MNKRFFLILTVFALLLSGCSQDKKPANMSESHYKYGLKALEIIDSYLDFDNNSKETRKMIEALIEEKDILPESEFKDPNHAKNFGIESKIIILGHELLMIDTGSGSYEDLLDKRNELAKMVNKKGR